MANTLKFIDMVARESLAIAHEGTPFIGTTDRQYDDSFGQNGAKIGSTLRVRDANRYTSTLGATINVQDSVESTQSVTIAQQRHVAMKFGSAELSLDTDSPQQVKAFSDRYIKPAVMQIMSDIEAEYLAFATKSTYNVAGAAGTAMTDLSVPGAARAKLNQGLAPKDSNRNIMMDSVTMGQLVNGSAAYFAPTKEIGDQYKEGLIARRAMADFYENERVWTLTNGSDVTISTDAAALVVDGTGALDFHTLTASQVAIGSVFTISGVYACHPETKARFGHLQQFTLVSGGATTGASVVSPAIYLTGARKNVVGATADLVAADFNAKTMTFIGAASTAYSQPLMYHKKAFQFVTAPLTPLDAPDRFSQKIQDGLSMSCWMQGDISSYELICRIDILYGYAALRPEWASRMIGSVLA